MKKILSVLGLSILVLSVLSSCTAERESNNARSGKNYTVRLNVTTGANSLTRAAATLGETRPDTAAFDREKNIDNLWAVVFKKQKDGTTYEFYKTFKVTERDGDDYKFDMENGGLYHMYIVANTSHNLQTTTGISEPEDLFQLIENSNDLKDPGADCQANKFLMTSKQLQVDIDGLTENNITVELTRAAARIDIDATRLNGFVITSVVFNNRYKTSYIARGVKGDDMTDAGLVKESKTYTASALTAISTNSLGVVDGVATDGNVWRGILYGYENLLASTNTSETTVVTINGTYNGRNVTRDVVFENIPLERNHLYNIDLIPIDTPDEYSEINYNIRVKDWETGEDIEWKGDALTASSIPDFKVSGDGVYYYGDNNSWNPTHVVAQLGERDILVEVTGTVTGSTLSSVDLTTEKGTVNKESVSNDADGNIVQVFKISLTDEAVANDDIHFVLANALDATQKREFIVTCRPKLPLEYMAEGSIKYLEKQDGYWVIDNDPTVFSSAFFNWTTAVTNFGQDDGTGRNPKNDVECSYTYTDSEGTHTRIGKYHLPTIYEWYGIVRTSHTDIFGTPTSRTVEVDPKVVIGNATLTAVQSEYIKNSTNSGIIYALRFIDAPNGNLYRCAYRYYFPGRFDGASTIWQQRYEVQCTYIGNDPAITSVLDVQESFWNSLDPKKIIFRNLPATSRSVTGNGNPGTNNRAASGGKNESPGYNTLYCTSTQYNSTYSYAIRMTVGPNFYVSNCSGAGTNWGDWGAGNSNTGATARLFSNN